MKYIYTLKNWVFIFLIPFLASCKYEYPLPIVNPNPGFVKSGLQVYNTNSEYGKASTTVTVSRTVGLSQEVEMRLVVIDSLVKEYNNLYEADYAVMGQKYFSIPNTVVFPANTKSVNIQVSLNPKAMVQDLGYDGANNLILPIQLMAISPSTDIGKSTSTVLLNPAVAAPLITVDTAASTTLSFLKSVAISQNVTIQSAANFNTVNISKVGFVADASKVATYNAANGTNYLLLPSGYFTVQEDVFDTATMKMTSVVKFDCSQLDESKTYLLPLMLQQTATYGISQDKPVYVVVKLADPRVGPVDGGNLVKIGGAQGSIGLRLNSPLLEDLNVPFVYEASKIATYNTANGTSYQALNASKIQLNNGKIVAGSLTGSASYSLDISVLKYDDGTEYLLPLTIDESQLTQGVHATDKPTVYLKLAKTITGNYSKQELTYTKSQANSENASSNFNTLIKLANGTSSGVPKSATAKNQKYAINYNKGWSDGLLYFNIAATEMSGKPGCYQLIDFQDRPEDFDAVVDHGSYINTNTGEIFFNISIMGYWSTAEINVRLHTRKDI